MAQSLILYFMLGLDQTFLQFLSVSYTLCMTSTAVAACIGALFTHPKSAQAMFTLVFVPQFYFSGVFISTGLIPKWIRWAQYLCSLTYGSRLAMLYEFRGCYDAGIDACEEILKQNEVETDNPEVYWASMLALFVLFRGAALLTLRHKGLNFE